MSEINEPLKWWQIAGQGAVLFLFGLLFSLVVCRFQAATKKNMVITKN